MYNYWNNDILNGQTSFRYIKDKEYFYTVRLTRPDNNGKINKSPNIWQVQWYKRITFIAGASKLPHNLILKILN